MNKLLNNQSIFFNSKQRCGVRLRFRNHVSFQHRLSCFRINLRTEVPGGRDLFLHEKHGGAERYHHRCQCRHWQGSCQGSLGTRWSQLTSFVPGFFAAGQFIRRIFFSIFYGELSLRRTGLRWKILELTNSRIPMDRIFFVIRAII